MKNIPILKAELNFQGSVSCGVEPRINGNLVFRAELLNVLKEIVDDESNVLENLNKLINFID